MYNKHGRVKKVKENSLLCNDTQKYETEVFKDNYKISIIATIT